MNANDIIRLLILNDSRDEAERLISMLRNAGRPSRAQHVESKEVLAKLLQEQPWDLLIGLDSSSNITPMDAIKEIKRLGKDIPVILLSDTEGSQPVVEGLKMGASDVVRLDEDQHLLLTIQRELTNLGFRQQQRISDRRFKESERRSQQLLDSSRDAIAYVQDGMCLYANDSFAELFGYKDKDDIECMPLIDMVSAIDQNKVKTFLKEFTLKGEGDTTDDSPLDFRGVSANDGEVSITVNVCHATYDEEPCIEFLSRANTAVGSEEIEEQIHHLKQQDLVTNLYNRQYLMEYLQTSVANIDHRTHGLLIISIDNFETQVQAPLGIAGTDTVLGKIAQLLNTHFSDHSVVARFGDDAFAVLVEGTTADLAVDMAQDFCAQIDKDVLEAEGKTAHITLSIGVALINETTSSVEMVVEQALAAVANVRSNGKGAGNRAKLFEPELSDAERTEENIGKLVQSAIKNNRFRLLYQPIHSLRGSDEEYYEVLLRMLNDDDEEVSPDTFLGAAAEMGAITKIDRWVILESIKQLSEHRARGNKTQLIVNISVQSMCDDSLVGWLAVAFKTAKLTTDSLVFQLAENDVTCHLNAAKAFVDGINTFNGAAAISRFGCALNPFKTLEHVNAAFVKVDGSFTRDIQDKDESPETLTNLIQQLHERDKITVVPFVENAGVLSTLWQAGVHYIQGHYLQAPASEMSYDFDTEG